MGDEMKKHKNIKIITIFILLPILLLLCIYLYAYISPKLRVDGANGYYLYDNKKKLFNGNNEDWASLNKISDNLINATISTEDKNFYKHKGFDLLRIVKAMFINVKEKKAIQGASTISQQYSKNLFLDFDKTWSRKLKEAWITVRLETHYTKNEILEGYLNTINYGGIFGIENASNYYFGKSADELSLAEASMLAGIPKNPSTYSPLVNESKAKERQKSILNSMVKNKYITKKAADEAYNEKLTYKSKDDSESLKMLMYYQDAVMDELESLDGIPTSFLDTGGLKIYTNLDKDAQKSLESAISKNITSDDIEVSAVALEPTNGKIIALTGGMDYNKSEYNRAIKSKRQVGSTIKPFLYYSALENGFTPSTTFTSEKTTFTFDNNKTYTPKNYNNEYPDKQISMAAAIAYSDNIYAVKTHLFLGENNLVNILKRVGITKNIDALPSLALGAEEINLMEMMEGYTVLASGGNKIKPYFISKITDMKGNIIYENKDKPQSILNKSTTYILNELLTTTYAKEFIDYNTPTCYSISPKLSHKYAIKSGTTNTDNLIFGYNKNILVGMWSGYDTNKEVTNKDSSNIKNAWADFTEDCLKDKNKEKEWYDVPENIVGVAVDPISGDISDNSSKSKMLYYIKGTEPKKDDYNLEDTIPTMKKQS